MAAQRQPVTTNKSDPAVREYLSAFAFQDEAEALAGLLPLAELHQEEKRQTDDLARKLVHAAQAAYGL